MKMSVRVQLSIMMLLNFTIWGAWYVTMGTYLDQTLGFSAEAIGAAYATTAIAAVISPFFVGMIADKFFPAQIVLGVLQLLGGALLYSTTMITSSSFFFWVLLAHTVCYMPSLALVNAIAFNQMKDPAKEFPGIRVVGTLAWIIMGQTLGYLATHGYAGIEATNLPFKIGAGVAILMGLYSFTLPNTPPRSKGKRVTVGEVLGLDALSLLKEPAFLVFTIGSLLICIPLQFYYGAANLFLNEIGVEQAAAKQTYGQMSEFLFLLVMPLFFARLGVKYMLLVGMLAWVARYFAFAFAIDGAGQPVMALVYTGIILHGVCFDFFFVTGQIYVDKKAPKEIQASAQGFIALITYGVGMLIGTQVMGKVMGIYTTVAKEGGATSHNWPAIWMVPAVMALVVMIAFAVLFYEKNGEADAKDAA